MMVWRGCRVCLRRRPQPHHRPRPAPPGAGGRLLIFSWVRWVWWSCGWRGAVGVACQPSPSAAGSCLPSLSRSQLVEARRVRAVELFGDGVSNAENARVVGCVPGVCGVGGGCGGKAVLRPCGDGQPPGAHPSWTYTQVGVVRAAVEQGARARGFEVGLGILARVGAVVTRTTGVVLSRVSVWRLLTGRLGWSLQRPERRAVERDESEIAR
ncbi:helix-turn-helix domain-containing protein [Streptomyces sp. enrichment culture]|uniref:helix-turn-helix domain-containing protein n=1 Tax=Streptomyces sp. enrichment culture TaxID=1795815 RepID=UPI003F5530BB